MGIVHSIPLESRITNNGIAVLDTEILIESAPEHILPGFSFIGEIIISGDEEILTLPGDAVMIMGERTMVFLGDGSQPTPTQVRVDELSDGRYSILSGLDEGDVVFSVSELQSRRESAGGQSAGNGLPIPGLRMPGGGGRQGGGLGGGRP